MFTAVVAALLSSAPSRDDATPSTHEMLGVVSHPPPIPFCSCSAVIVLPPAALSVSVIVASTAPSPASAVSPPPTLSRSLPLNVRASVAGAGTFTVNAFGSDPPMPLGLMTTTARPPAVAAPSIANDAVRRVDETKATFVTVISAPAPTVAPLANPLPSIVTGTVEPAMPWAGDTELTVTGTFTLTANASDRDPPLALVTVTATARPPAAPAPAIDSGRASG